MAEGRGTTSLGRDNPTRRVGYVSANAVFDRKSADIAKRNDAKLALHEIYDPQDLDVLPDEIAFKVSGVHYSPYDGSRNALPILTSLNGLQAKEFDDPNASEQAMAEAIEDSIVPMGIAIDRLEYKEATVMQMARKQVAVQTNGKTSLRAGQQKDIPIGAWVKAVVPTPSDVRARTDAFGRASGRSRSKVTLEVAEAFANGASFASRVNNMLQERVRTKSFPVDTAKNIALSNIEDLLISLYWRDEDDEKAQGIGGNRGGDFDATGRLTSLLEVYVDNRHVKMVGAFADLLRLEGNSLLGRVTHSKNKVYDVVL